MQYMVLEYCWRTTVSAISGTTVTLDGEIAINGGDINFVDADGLGAQVLNNGAVAIE